VKPLTPFMSTDPRVAPAPTPQPVEDEPPVCEKCGVPITTGAMAILCPLNKECALRDEDNAESIDSFREAFGINAKDDQ
jgi:hypothetical protein